MATQKSDGALRIVEYHLGGGMMREIRTESIDFQPTLGQFSKLSFTVSQATRQTMNTFAEYAVEQRLGNGWREPVSARFIGLNFGSDSDVPGGAVTVQAQAFAEFFLQRALVGPKDYEQEDIPVNQIEVVGPPGFVMFAFIDDAFKRGWGPSLSVDFRFETDSAGASWEEPGWESINYTVGTDLSSILNGFIQQGFIDVRTVGRLLQMFRVSPGLVMDNIRVGRRSQARPSKTSIENVRTQLDIQIDGGATLSMPVPGANVSLGRLETSIQGGGVTAQAQIELMAAQLAVNSAQPQTEYTVTLSAQDLPDGAIPMYNFSPGDTVWAYLGDSWQMKKLVGLNIRQDGTGATYDLYFEFLKDSFIKKIASAVASETKEKVGNGQTPAPPQNNPAGGMYATIAEPMFSGQLINVWPDGNIEQMLSVPAVNSYKPAVADRVYLAPAPKNENGTTLIIIDRLKPIQLDVPPLEPVPEGNYLAAEQAIFGNPKFRVTKNGWVVFQGAVMGLTNEGGLGYTAFTLGDDKTPLLSNSQPWSTGAGNDGGSFAIVRNDGRVATNSNVRPVVLGSMTWNVKKDNVSVIGYEGGTYTTMDPDGIVYLGNNNWITENYNGNQTAFNRSDFYINQPVIPEHRPAAPVHILTRTWDGYWDTADQNVVNPDGSWSFRMPYALNNVFRQTFTAIYESPTCTLNWLPVPLQNGWLHGDFSAESKFHGPLMYAVASDGTIVVKGIAYGGLERSQIGQIQDAFRPEYRTLFPTPYGEPTSDGALTGTGRIEPDGSIWADGPRVFLGGYHRYQPVPAE